MKKLTCIFITLLIGLFIAEAAFAKRVEIAIEAEHPHEIVAPMKVDDDPNASRGKFIWMEGKPATGGGGAGYATYIINIPTADKYAVWGQVIAWDGNSDSFWVTFVPPDPADENPQASGNTDYRWATAQGATWHWDRINAWKDGGTFDREWKMDVGEHKLTIWVREDATMLDALFITNNLSADPGSAGARLPTDKEVELWLKGMQAVKSAGKVAMTWGNIKLRY